MTLRALDLFAGIGGWALACEARGISTVAACEIDAWKRAQYAVHFPDTRLYCDVRSLTAERLNNDGIAVDVVVGSPPCTDASAANHRGRGIDGEETGLFLEAVRLLGEIRPRWACFENSPRLPTRGIDRVVRELEAVGYACWLSVVGAVHAGAPHVRQRVWIAAADADRYRLRDQSGRSRGAGRLGAAEPADHAHANGQGQPPLPVDAEMGRGTGTDGDGGGGGDAANADGFSGPPREAGEDGAQADHTSHAGWSDGPASLARHLRVADGVSAGLAAYCRSAYGDAIVPQVGSAALAGMIALDRFLTSGRAI